MKPIPSLASNEAISQLERAQRLLEKADKLEKSAEYKADGMCPCGSGKPQAECCPDISKSAEGGSQPNFQISFDTKPQDVMFAAESGGQTRNAHYTTNQHLLDAEDVTNKGATSEAFNLESLGGKLNPHEGGGSDRQVVDGILSKAKDMVEKGICRECGGNQFTGCQYGIASCDGLQGTGFDTGGYEMRHDPSDPSRSIY